MSWHGRTSHDEREHEQDDRQRLAAYFDAVHALVGYTNGAKFGPDDRRGRYRGRITRAGRRGQTIPAQQQQPQSVNVRISIWSSTPASDGYSPQGSRGQDRSISGSGVSQQ
jgi:hypothetical protein